MYTIKTPKTNPDFTGSTAIGPAILSFNDGTATYSGDLAEGTVRYLEGAGYTVEKTETAKDENGQYDPSGHKVEDVLAYLGGADATERDRVLAAEAAGKNRKAVVEFGATPEAPKADA